MAPFLPMDGGAWRSVIEQAGLPAEVAIGPELGSPGRTSVRSVGDDLFVKVFLGRSGRKPDRERAALELLAASSLVVPRLVGHGRLDDGSPWVLINRLPGQPLGRQPAMGPPTDEDRIEWYRWAGRTARALRQVAVPAFGPWTVDPADDPVAYHRQRSAGLLDEAIAQRWLELQLLERIAAAQRELEPSLRWIDRPVLVHRDLNPHNLLGALGADGRWTCTGVIDFESSGGGDPLEELRWLAVAEPQEAAEDAFLDGWGSTIAAHRDGLERVRYHQLDLVLDIGTWPTMEDRSLIERAERAANRLLAL